MRQSIQVPTGSLDVRGPFGQDLLYGAAHGRAYPLVHEIRHSGLAIARVIHNVCTIVPGAGRPSEMAPDGLPGPRGQPEPGDGLGADDVRLRRIVQVGGGSTRSRDHGHNETPEGTSGP